MPVLAESSHRDGRGRPSRVWRLRLSLSILSILSIRLRVRGYVSGLSPSPLGQSIKITAPRRRRCIRRRGAARITPQRLRSKNNTLESQAGDLIRIEYRGLKNLHRVYEPTLTHGAELLYEQLDDFDENNIDTLVRPKHKLNVFAEGERIT